MGKKIKRKITPEKIQNHKNKKIKIWSTDYRETAKLQK